MALSESGTELCAGRVSAPCHKGQTPGRAHLHLCRRGARRAANTVVADGGRFWYNSGPREGDYPEGVKWQATS